MLDSLYNVLIALWHQDFTALMAPGSAAFIYVCVGTLILLESGFIPAAPFPCDSVVILSGTLAAVGVINAPFAFCLIFICAASGSWLGYMQGRWLNRLPRVQSWVNAVPQKRLDTVDKLLGHHGLVALFVARFIPVVRSLLPLVMGMRVSHATRFHYFSWLSALLWTLLLTGTGYILPSLPEPISKTVTMMLMMGPVITLTIAVLSAVIIKVRRMMKPAKQPAGEA